MYNDIRRVRLAGQLRRARESLSHAHAELLDIGLDEFSFKLTNVELELLELHRDLIQPFCQPPARRERPLCDQPAQGELPF